MKDRTGERHGTERTAFAGFEQPGDRARQSDGRVVWATELTGMMGDGFVTVHSDGQSVYAFSKGRIHGLNIRTGRVLWTNELKGYGYGVATICLPGFGSAPEAAAYAKIQADAATAASSAQ